jgi:hypothetical protein
LPFTLGPQESRNFSLSIRMPKLQESRKGDPTYLEVPLTLFTSNRAQSRLALAIRGEVRE